MTLNLRMADDWQVPASTSDSRYGAALAERVADLLEAGLVLAHGHRDYCGMGLQCEGGVWAYGEFWDGLLQEAKEAGRDPGRR